MDGSFGYIESMGQRMDAQARKGKTSQPTLKTLMACPAIYSAHKIGVGPRFTAERRPEAGGWEVMEGTGHIRIVDNVEEALDLIADLDDKVVYPQDVTILVAKVAQHKGKSQAPMSVTELLDELTDAAARMARVEYRINIMGGEDEDAAVIQDLKSRVPELREQIIQYKQLILKRMK